MAQPGRLRPDRGDRARLREQGHATLHPGQDSDRSWDDKESGQKRYWTEIFVHDLTLLGGGRGVDGVYYRGKRKEDLSKAAEQDRELDYKYGQQELSPDEIPF